MTYRPDSPPRSRSRRLSSSRIRTSSFPMKPTSLRLPEKSLFFTSPYHSQHSSSSRLSPIPDNSPSTNESGSSPLSATNSHTPLLPSPGAVEGASFPFPVPRLWTRVRMAMGGKAMARGGLMKRLLLVAVLAGLAVVFHHSGRGKVCR